jgi:hypothetical protein
MKECGHFEFTRLTSTLVALALFSVSICGAADGGCEVSSIPARSARWEKFSQEFQAEVKSSSRLLRVGGFKRITSAEPIVLKTDVIIGQPVTEYGLAIVEVVLAKVSVITNTGATETYLVTFSREPYTALASWSEAGAPIVEGKTGEAFPLFQKVAFPVSEIAFYESLRIRNFLPYSVSNDREKTVSWMFFENSSDKVFGRKVDLVSYVAARQSKEKPTK